MNTSVLLAAGAIVAALSLPAEAAVVGADHQLYLEGARARMGGPDTAGAINLNDVPNRGGPTVGPIALNTSFDQHGDRVDLRGRVVTSWDSFSVDVTEGTNIQLSVAGLSRSDRALSIQIVSDAGTETFELNGAGVVGVFAGLSEFTIDGLSNRTLDYDLQLLAMGGSPELVATPIPGAVGLLGTALAGLAAFRRYRSAAA